MKQDAGRDWETVVGLEVHAELCTQEKLFCHCANRFGAAPNTLCCPVCRGEGAAPVLNRQAAEFAVCLGLALGCEISRVSGFDRKYYDYPDLPKGYQITQQRQPIAQNGVLPFLWNKLDCRMEIERIQLEEDTARLSVGPAGEGRIDYNRCGVPLVEIITRPQVQGSGQAKAFLAALAATMLALGVSDGKAQEGSLRADVNVSVRRRGEAGLRPRCELKNISGFGAITRAIEAEAARQMALYEAGETIQPETRRWDDKNRRSVFLRPKEGCAQYLYEPEPQLVPLYWEEPWLQAQKAHLPELPYQKKIRYCEELGLSAEKATALAYHLPASLYFTHTIEYKLCKAETLANWILVEIPAITNDFYAEDGNPVLPPGNLAELVRMVEKGELSNLAAKALLPEMLHTGSKAKELAARHGLLQNNKPEDLQELAREILAAHPSVVRDFQEGKKAALDFLVGQGMKKSKGAANPAMLREWLQAAMG